MDVYHLYMMGYKKGVHTDVYAGFVTSVDKAKTAEHFEELIRKVIEGRNLNPELTWVPVSVSLLHESEEASPPSTETVVKEAHRRLVEEFKPPDLPETHEQIRQLLMDLAVGAPVQ